MSAPVRDVLTALAVALVMTFAAHLLSGGRLW